MEKERISHLRRQAIDIHRAFAAMHPVIQRTRLLSLNAVVASARTGRAGESFAIIAKELSVVASELSRLIGEMEDLFHRVVQQVARSVRVEEQNRLFRRSLDCALRETPVAPAGPPAAWDAVPPDPRAPESKLARAIPETAAVDALLAAPTPGPAEPAPRCGDVTRALLRQRIEEGDHALLQRLEEVEGLSRQFVRRIHRINWVAVRQSHITAVAARIEAARSDKGTGLTDVAGIVRELADQIGVSESAAKGKIEDLCALAAAVVNPLRLEQARAQPGAAQ